MTKQLKWRIVFVIILALIFVLLVIFLPILVVHAESEYYIKFSFQADNLNTVIETKDPLGIHLSQVELVAPPLIKDGRFWIPVRALENFGMTVKWNSIEKKITVYNQNGIELQYWLGKSIYFLNEQKKSMDVSPFIANGRTYIPLRFFAEALGAQEIQFIAETKSVVVIWPLGLD